MTVWRIYENVPVSRRRTLNEFQLARVHFCPACRVPSKCRVSREFRLIKRFYPTDACLRANGFTPGRLPGANFFVVTATDVLTTVHK